MFDYRASNTFNYFSELNPERRALIRAVHQQQEAGGDLERVLGQEPESIEEASNINLQVFEAPLMAAIERYGPGPMYRAMEFETLPTGAQRRLLENGVIVSAMFGLLRPDDLIPDYRLSIHASLDGLGAVTSYWRDVVSPHLNRLVEDRVVWNLLPASHAAVWDDGGTYDRQYRVRFAREEAGRRVPVPDDAPELNGSLVHYIADRLVEAPEALMDWDAPDGFEPVTDEFELDDKGGTLTYVRFDDWEARRSERHAARIPRAVSRETAEDEAENPQA
jgi:cytoplasmic iron level regulating protein YaaA (DUF328/UPF0246 family)